MPHSKISQHLIPEPILGIFGGVRGEIWLPPYYKVKDKISFPSKKERVISLAIINLSSSYLSGEMSVGLGVNKLLKCAFAKCIIFFFANLLWATHLPAQIPHIETQEANRIPGMQNSNDNFDFAKQHIIQAL
jgi:hypothetical protein